MGSVDRCVAGIDVHKSLRAVVVRREREGQIVCKKRKLGATRSAVGALAAFPAAEPGMALDDAPAGTVELWYYSREFCCKRSRSATSTLRLYGEGAPAR
jgi:hypothetical protein